MQKVFAHCHPGHIYYFLSGSVASEILVKAFLSKYTRQIFDEQVFYLVEVETTDDEKFPEHKNLFEGSLCAELYHIEAQLPECFKEVKKHLKAIRSFVDNEEYHIYYDTAKREWEYTSTIHRTFGLRSSWSTSRPENITEEMEDFLRDHLK